MSAGPSARSAQEIITSRDNRWLKRFRAALEGPPGKDEHSVGLEGPHLVEEGFRSGTEIEAVLVCDEGERHLARLKAWMTPEVRLLRCSTALFASVAATETPQGIAALARPKQYSLGDLLGDVPLVVVLAGAQDPGNVGTLVRSAEAFGATGAVACHGTAHPYSPKALRASAGSALRLPLQIGVDAKSLLPHLRDAELRVYAASLAGEATPAEADLTVPCALVIGNEAAGLAPEIERAADERLRIPLEAGVESLNAAVAGAVLLYEAARQRGTKHRLAVEGEP
jgi:TrmH family RNA methyltransferase